ncbi:plasmid mobilization relaxosome protein MobC [Tardiphaga sp. 215_C5_N2_1]|uniref:plasmid mobilization relaxosome protein MobC n=1 Tax=Tardiphaga sp. 215_C5_N2_1 TaxID=3240774 RepID=UPI003F8B069E
MTKSGDVKQAQPFSIRLTETEKEQLRKRAGSIPLGVFIRNLVFGDERVIAVAAQRYPLKDAEPLGRLLGMLGQSRLANNLNQLAKAANQGSLPVTAELETDLSQACADIREMRHLLLRALGMQILDAVQDDSPLADSFADAVGRIQK